MRSFFSHTQACFHAFVPTCPTITLPDQSVLHPERTREILSLARARARSTSSPITAYLLFCWVQGEKGLLEEVDLRGMEFTVHFRGVDGKLVLIYVAGSLQHVDSGVPVLGRRGGGGKRVMLPEVETDAH